MKIPTLELEAEEPQELEQYRVVQTQLSPRLSRAQITLQRPTSMQIQDFRQTFPG
jgi:hypothetical protein